MLLIFFTLVSKIIPLYLLIALGYIAGKYLQASKETVARILIYIIAPTIVFHSVLTTPLAANILSLPLLFFVLSSFLCIVTFTLVKHTWPDATKNILAFTAGSGNTGYFGLPVAIALFGDAVAGLVILSTLGLIVYENTVGFFVTARGHHTIRESIIRLLRLPTLYAFFLAYILNITGFKLTQGLMDFALLFRGAYTILGMMLIGLALANIPRFKLDIKFITVSFTVKFIVWPIAMFTIIALDKAFLGFFTEQIHSVMILLSIVPLAANTVAFATELRTHPEKAASAVLLSTVFALFYIPFISVLFLT